jgi:hypothetical protein
MTEEKPENVGVANPYAMAEVVLKQPIAWGKVGDPRKILEDTLGISYEKLFDPKYDSPLYAGLRYRPETKRMEHAEIPPTVEGGPKALVDAEAVVYLDPGDFFEDGVELTDPIQGALGDCYLIAAFASVAWSRPYVIAHRVRRKDGSGSFVDMIEFWKGSASNKVEVNEIIPLNSPGNTFIYARSSDKGEIWPAIYEKAYVKWRTGKITIADYAKIAGGDPVGAAAQVTGFTPYYYWTSGRSMSDIWSKVNNNCASRKAVNPMVAWTYPSGDASPDKIKYSDANLVANHAYSILGVQRTNGQKYIVLRNPWGWKEATMNIDGGNWTAWDIAYPGGPGIWRTISMATSDGIFALRTDTFKKYFAGFGVVT